MPLPTKNANESKPEFIARCMAASKMLTEYPEAPQRFAVCQTQWSESTK
jgi:hypothetical protein